MQAPQPRRTTWPNVLGILSIVLGALGVLTYGAGGIELILTGPTVPASAPHADAIGVGELVSNLVHCLLAVLLLAAGIQLVRRRPAARRLYIVWAVLRTAAALGGTVVAYLMMQALIQDEQANGTTSADVVRFMEVYGLATLVIALLWSLALPIFALIWFNRPKIRQEMRRW